MESEYVPHGIPRAESNTLNTWKRNSPIGRKLFSHFKMSPRGFACVLVVNNGAFFFECGEFNDTPTHGCVLASEVNCLSGALFSSIEMRLLKLFFRGVFLKRFSRDIWCEVGGFKYTSRERCPHFVGNHNKNLHRKRII